VTAACPACASDRTEVVTGQDRVPVNSCLLVETSAAATSFPTGRIDLAVCHNCGFVFNASFDPSKVEYSGRYEETQACSARFREFAEDLAQTWIDKYDIHGKTVTEIGCGKAEFLNLICTLGDNHGIGIDPGVDGSRFSDQEKARMDLRAEFYDDAYGPLDSDVVICRHTLEHIDQVADFMRTVRAGIGGRLDTIVLFELPDVARVLAEGAFWDVYYEHCTYFTAGSLARLFRNCGFLVDDVRLDFDGQYILLEARPAPGEVDQQPLPIEDSPADVVALARTYGEHVAGVVDRWKSDIGKVRDDGGKVAIWGAGSKGVSFLSNIGPGNISIAVDINPRKAGKFMPGTAQEVIVPEDLPEAGPALVVAMNEIYLDEIAAQLSELGVEPALRAV
jgi:C-methyltransferase C-terminal domain/Methyltransferase domain